MVDTMDLVKIGEEMRAAIEVKDRKHHLTKYQQCFRGTDAVGFLIESKYASSEEEAELLGEAMVGCGVFHHVLNAEPFKNKDYFYRFIADEDHGEEKKKEDGSAYSWADVVRSKLFVENNTDMSEFQPDLPERDPETEPAPVAAAPGEGSALGVSPMDEYNVKLVDLVHPPEWQNPSTDGVYNLVAIGAGAGGLVATSAAAGAGAKVALIEKHLMGGDCLNVGCVPSKALIKAARVAHYIRSSEQYGIKVQGMEVDFGKVMERMRMLRAEIAPVDSAVAKAQKGVDVLIGKGTFLDKNTIEVVGDDGEKKTIKFKKAVIATGGSPTLPPIPGLAEAPYHTNLTLFNLEHLPPRMIVIGAGPIGLEMAQSFQRFGSNVTVLLRGNKLLPKEDPDAAQIIHNQLVADGLLLEFGLKFENVTHTPAKPGSPFPTITIHAKADGRDIQFSCEVLLVATGRKPNVEGIGLENAGVKYDVRQGVQVNDKLQTTTPHIYAAGDCCTKFQFTHVSGQMGVMAMRNALFFGKAKVSQMLIPWATFTEPEVAHVGLYPQEMDAKGIKYDTYTKHLEDVDRAILEQETEGFVKVHTKAGTDKIIGATIVASAAGEMISEITLAMQYGIGLGSIGAVIHPYPTQAEAIKGAAGAYNVTKLTPFVRGLLNNIMAVSRK